MDIIFLDGPSLFARIPNLIKKSDEVCLAVAFVKKTGLISLYRSLEELLRRKGKAHILIGLSPRYHITDTESLRQLLDLGKKGAEVRRWKSSGFHPKLFLFRRARTYSIAIGSSNLTGAAGTQNAEANVLIKNPSPDFLKHARDFFDFYFGRAKKLTRTDVSNYEKKARAKASMMRKRIPEETLPLWAREKLILETSRFRKIWKISPGPDACCWPEWYERIDSSTGEGLIAIGWNAVGNIAGLSWQRIKKKVIKAKETWLKEGWKPPRVKYVTDQLWSFANEIDANDLIIIYSERRVLGIAKAKKKSPYYFYPRDDEVEFKHRCNVQYVWSHPWPPIASQRLVNLLGKNKKLGKNKNCTLMEVTNRKILSYIVSSL